MLSRSAFGRTAPRALRTQYCAASVNSRRGLASAAAPSLQYETAEAAGVKFANREVDSPTTTLSLVAKAGPRYQPFPGFSDALEQFAFKSTLKRSGLRITRETELLGSEVSAKRSRENIILQAKFLSGDLPYFAELLAEVASQTKFATHELNELVLDTIKHRQKALFASPESLALDAAHGTAFHRGLGENIVPSTSTPFEQYLSVEAIAEFAKGAYAKPNIALVSTGPSSSELSKWVSQFFGELPSSTASGQFKPKESAPSKFYGGEQRIPSKAGNAVVIAFPGSATYGASAYKPEVAVLAALLGGESSIKYTRGFSLLSKAAEGFTQVHVSTKNHAYSDAGLFAITISGKADQVASVSKNAVDVLKRVAAGDVSSEDFNKAVALAKFRALEAAQLLETGVELTGAALISGGKPYQIGEVAQSFSKVSQQQVQELAKSYLSGKASVAAVGDLFKLPFAEDLGLTV
ncbi:hypothetical protein VTN77DRAFT_1560 [Rasamsonia byssochlamydoides]|uniref:uncharacterized protein n=1 Tax=Rasamsonia byssochlamydoides TaxID=89139 RepID=UPI00374385D5